MSKSNLENALQNTIGIEDILTLAKDSPAADLFELLYSEEGHIARNAAWALTHKTSKEVRTLPQDRLVDLALATPDTSLRRLLLRLIECQGIPSDEIRTDLLDFCLKHMVMLEEPPGVQALCMKLAHSMCSHYPELQHEFDATLNMMHTEYYKPGVRHQIKKLKKDVKT